MLKYASDIDVSNWPYRWPHVRFDLLDNIEKMTIDTLDTLNDMCHTAATKYGWSYLVNSDYRPNGTGQHPKGRAVDLVFYDKTPGDVNVLSQFVFALRFNWTGVGFYPQWDIPGIHVDTRQNAKFTAQWWRDESSKYRSVNDFFDGADSLA